MRKYAVITGASSGIGREFAYQLSSQYNLILVARRKEKLEELSQQLKCDCIIYSIDLSLKDQCFHLCDLIKDYDIEVFINNAGFGDCGYFLNTSIHKELDMINVDIEALHIMTKFMLKYFNEKNKGYLLNVASVAGLMPAGPYMAAYYAAKSYVTSLTRAIAYEIKDSPVYIGCLCPGPVDTEFNKVANVEFALPGITAHHCVEYAIKKMNQRKTVIIPTLSLKLAMILGKLIPQSLYIKIAAHQQKKKFK